MSTQFHSGNFEVTDRTGALIFKGVVEKSASVIKPLYWVNISYFAGGFASVSYTSIELRALALTLKKMAYDSNEKYLKNSGGNKKNKTIRIEYGDEYYRFVIEQDGEVFKIAFNASHLEAIAQEIEELVNYTNTNTYKTQQHFERLKKKNSEGGKEH